MLSTRWIKLVRDLEATPAHIAIMLLAIAAGVFAFTLMLSTYNILSREVSQNYLATHPASASLAVENIDADLLAGIRRFPGIVHAQAGATVNADLILPDGAIHPLKIFVVEDFNQLQLNQFFAEAGAWPPSPNTVLLERYSLAQLKAKIGDALSIRLNDGSLHSLPISGSVRDPAMPVPSMVAFAYISQSSLIALGVSVPLNELKISVNELKISVTELKISESDQPLNADAIERTASQLALWIEQQSYQGHSHKVSAIRIPPPGEHPHGRIIFAVSGVFVLFSGVALMLSAVLTATLMEGLMAKQLRQIGVMKAIGASALQIAALYLVFVLILSALATSLGLFAGLAASRALAAMLLASLNFSLHSAALPFGIYLALIAAGVLLPLLMAAVPIIQTTRLSVQSALVKVGTQQQHYAGAARGLAWLGVDRSLMMALRNCFRRRGRMALILSLLTSAGAIFISSLNLKYATEEHLIAAAAERHYDLELSLDNAVDRKKIISLIRSVQGVVEVEAWAMTSVGRHRADGLNIERTYADGGHGAVFLTAIPQGSKLLSIKMQQGHWLKGDERNGEDSVVLNRKALEIFPRAELDSQIALGSQNSRGSQMDGDAREKALPLRVVGLAAQKMTGGMAYVSAATYQKMTGQDENYKNYRVVLDQHDEKFIDATLKKINTRLAQQKIKVNNTLTETTLRREVDDHLTLLINALMFVSILMGLVGVMGLASVMSTQITERTREFGIMRSIGASSAIILRNVIAEGIFMSVMSWFFAVLISLLVSLVVSNFLGKLIFDEAFPLALSLDALWIWLVVVVASAILASIYPATKAVRITIRESFSV